MPDEKIPRGKAWPAVRDGKLPSRRPDRTWGGSGVGASCAVCELPVQPSVHIRCFAAWEFVRTRAGQGG
jgi:hypothetical protein